MSSSDSSARAVIGWREWVSLPGLHIAAVKAKVDTGARSSSLHAYDIREYRNQGVSMVRFKVHPLQRDTSETVEAEAELYERRMVRNPGGGGREELRPVIVTDLELGGQRWPIELTLTRRDAMGFRMLLVRQAVRTESARRNGSVAELEQYLLEQGRQGASVLGSQAT